LLEDQVHPIGELSDHWLYPSAIALGGIGRLLLAARTGDGLSSMSEASELASHKPVTMHYGSEWTSGSRTSRRWPFRFARRAIAE